jgi:hypothetical protein
MVMVMMVACWGMVVLVMMVLMVVRMLVMVLMMSFVTVEPKAESRVQQAN